MYWGASRSSLLVAFIDSRDEVINILELGIFNAKIINNEGVFE